MKRFTINMVVWICAIYYQGSFGGNTIECYYCTGECQNPLPSLTCYDIDNNISCYSSVSTTDNGDGTIDYMKGCAIDADTDFQGYCSDVNDGGGLCYTCQEDLCNEDNEN